MRFLRYALFLFVDIRISNIFFFSLQVAARNICYDYLPLATYAVTWRVTLFTML